MRQIKSDCFAEPTVERRHQDFMRERLMRIEGQVRGLFRIVEEDRYCIDIVTQISAVRAAPRRVEEKYLGITSATASSMQLLPAGKADQRRKIEEPMAVVSRADR